jgi:1-deoxy-D-xylulose-5-phosphate reductoisomerase
MKETSAKKIVVLGSTGSLGTQTLEVVKKYKKYFKIIGISANENQKLLDKQAKILKLRKNRKITVLKDGEKEILKLAGLKEADIVVNVISGVGGIKPSMAALQAGKKLILGNKESLVSEGTKLLKMPGEIIPVDSEHNAIFEILKKFPEKKVKKITIPCSGGPFWNKNTEFLQKVRIKDVLKHPKWDMGKKILVESATLINKGLEIIEAHYLFKIPIDKIKVVIHPECLVHGMAEFSDGKKYAYISKPDMKEHIENALLYAAKIPSINRTIRELKPREYGFRSLAHKNLRGIKIVMKAFRGNPEKMKKFLGKEEKIIREFLAGKIKFLDIFKSL